MTLEDLYRLLRNDHVRSEGIVNTLREPLLVLDAGLCVVDANPAFLRTFSVERADTLGSSLFKLGSGQWDIPGLRALLADVVPKSAAIIGYEVSHDFPGLGRRTVLVNARRLAHPDDNSTQMLLVFEDVTVRRQAEVAKDMLLAETHHRMKNLLAVVRALASQTEAKDRTGEEYKKAFMGRFEAVLSAQNLSSLDSAETELAAIVSKALEHVASRHAAISPGPSVKIPKADVVPLTMILHELTTNALKYGALSVPEGIVRVNWNTEGDGQKRVLVDWREEGGPAALPPSRKGFGTRLIEYSAKAEMGGEAKFNFAPAGLHVRLTLPIA